MRLIKIECVILSFCMSSDLKIDTNVHCQLSNQDQKNFIQPKPISIKEGLAGVPCC